MLIPMDWAGGDSREQCLPISRRESPASIVEMREAQIALSRTMGGESLLASLRSPGGGKRKCGAEGDRRPGKRQESALGRGLSLKRNLT